MATFESGPNLNLFDQIPNVRESPLFTGWRDAIPPEWFTANKRTYTLVDQEALYGSLQFARSYGRVAAETVPTPTDVASLTAFTKLRAASDIVAAPAETITSLRIFKRYAVDSVSGLGDSAFAVQNHGSMIKRIIDRWP